MCVRSTLVRLGCHILVLPSDLLTQEEECRVAYTDH